MTKQTNDTNVPRQAERSGAQQAASVDAADQQPSNSLAAMAAPPTEQDEQPTPARPGEEDNERLTPDHLSADADTERGAQVEEGDNDRPANFQRRPFGSQLPKLYYPQRKGYHRHWFNDKPGRVDRAKQAGYAIVRGNDGKPVCRVVTGGGMRAFLMEIPLHLYNEDMLAQQKTVDEIDKAIRAGKMSAPNAQEEAARYVPTKGIRFAEDR